MSSFSRVKSVLNSVTSLSNFCLIKIRTIRDSFGAVYIWKKAFETEGRLRSDFEGGTYWGDLWFCKSN